MGGGQPPTLAGVGRAVRIGLGVALALAGALAAAVVWGLPVLVHAQLEQRLGQALGREVTVAAVRTSLLRLAVEVDGLRVAARDPAQAPQFELAGLQLDASWRSLWQRAPVVERLTLHAPSLRLRRLADGSTDLDDLRARLAAGDDAAAGAPARFALYNLRVDEGRLALVDEQVGTAHHVEALTLALPFLSSLPLHAAVEIAPRLAFVADGARFDTDAVATPFAEQRRARLRLSLAGLDLAPWLPHLLQRAPGLPLLPAAGRLAGELAVDFEQPAGAPPLVRLSGRVTLGDAALVAVAAADTDPALRPQLRWQRLDVELIDVQPLQRRAQLGRVALAGLHAELARDAQGRLVWPAPAPAAAGPGAQGAGWQVAVDAFELSAAGLRWRDAAAAQPVDWRIAPIALATGPLAWPLQAPVSLRFELAAPVAAGATGRPAGREAASGVAALRGDGEFDAQRLRVQAELQPLELATLAPYLGQVLRAQLEGRFAGRIGLDWVGGEQPRLQLAVPEAWVERLRLREAPGAEPALAWQRLELAGLRLDLRERQIGLERIAARQPRLALRRDAEGRWNAAGWLAAAGAAPPPAVASPPASSPRPGLANGWALQLGQVRIEAGWLDWTDAHPRPDGGAAPAGPVRLGLRELHAELRGLQWPAAAGAAPATLALAARLATPDGGADTPGRVQAGGRVSVEPPGFAGRLDAERLPLHALVPYVPQVDAGLGVDILRALAGWRGTLDLRGGPAGWSATARGDAELAELRVHGRAEAGGGELLGWQLLALRGLRLDAPHGQRPAVEIAEVVLEGLDTRLVVTEQGRFNLRELAAAEPAAAPPATPTAPAAAAVLPLDLAVGGVRLVNGRIDFHDRFIRPNYHAELSALEGRLGAWRSGARQPATLELRGRAAGTADLQIRGVVDPGQRPPTLDLQARASGLELAPLSPYAGRFAGYTIERGRLTMDVSYRIDADGSLQAGNRIVLEQLTFGERVDSPLATRLPLRFALALLADRDGVVDIDLPISGSINDPQFSVWGLVWRMVGNLIVRAVTAPFALLAGAGGPELSRVGFAAGTHELAPEAATVLDRVAQAMAERPALRLTVAGSADGERERAAMQAAALQMRLRAEQRREALRAGAAADAPLPPLEPAQRERLLQRLYREAPLPDRPRNALGLLRTLPAAEAEARLRAAIAIGDDAVRGLALQRAQAVREALLARGLAADRVFLGAPLLPAPGAADGTGADPGGAKPAAGVDAASAAWTPHAELSVSMR